MQSMAGNTKKMAKRQNEKEMEKVVVNDDDDDMCADSTSILKLNSLLSFSC